jgi:DNA-binding transcriptional regulator YiaG
MKMTKKSATKSIRRAASGSSAATRKAAAPRRDSRANEMRRISDKYRLSNEALSRVTGASPRTVSYWNAGTPPQRSSAQKLKEVTRMFDALADIIQAKAIGPWLQQPNVQFEGSTPLQVIERGEGDRIWRMIWQLREGNSG